jgi:hypothetical protein
MIQNDQELKATQERILYFEGLVAQFRVTTTAPEFELMSGGYLAEVEKMNAEVLDYLRRHPTQTIPAEAA